MLALLRVFHIMTGVFWAGTLFFMVSFLQPAMKDSMPESGKVMGALRARGLLNKLPIIALVTIISGFWMFAIRSGGTTNFGQSREGMAFGIGGLAAVIAFLVGFFIMRPATLRAGDAGAAAAQLPAGAEKDAKMAEAGQNRMKSVMAARLVATLLGITVLTMAVAKYI